MFPGTVGHEVSEWAAHGGAWRPLSDGCRRMGDEPTVACGSKTGAGRALPVLAGERL